MTHVAIPPTSPSPRPLSSSLVDTDSAQINPGIELIDNERCTLCNVCVRVCPTDVFDAVPGAPPRIARQDVCQTCFMCEIHCPDDAMYVAPLRHPAPGGRVHLDLPALKAGGYLGSFRHRLGEVAAMAASARWAYLSAAGRTESRAMRVREDCTETEPSQRRRALVSGLDAPRVMFAEIEDPMSSGLDYAREAAA